MIKSFRLLSVKDGFFLSLHGNWNARKSFHSVVFTTQFNKASSGCESVNHHTTASGTDLKAQRRRASGVPSLSRSLSLCFVWRKST